MDARNVALATVALGAAISAWAGRPAHEPSPGPALAAAPTATCHVVVPAAARDEQAALHHLRQQLHRQDCRAGSWLEVRGLPIRQTPFTFLPVPDWTARLCAPGNLFEDAETGPVANFNCTYNGFSNLGPT